MIITPPRPRTLTPGARLSPLMLTLMLSFITCPVAAQASGIAGTWFTEDSASRVTITEDAGSVSARVSWLRNGTATAPLDAKNKDATLQSRPILGIDLLTGCTAAGDNRWEKCRIYVPRRGSTYDASLQLNPDGTLSVKVKAGVGGRTVTWYRTS